MIDPLHSYEQKFRPFTDSEAWLLFRLAAFGETVGWSLLILGICLERFVLNGAHWPVAIAGRIHGTLFIVYMAAALLLYPSLRWRRWLALVAVAASVPPFGSFVFERIVASHRHYVSGRDYLYRSIYYKCTHTAYV